MKNLAINLQPLIYGAFSGCRNYTVRAHLRNADTVKRRGCENRQQYAGALRRGIHPPHLHPRYKVEARRGSTNNGQFHGAGHASRKRTKNAGEKTKHSLRCSLNLSGHFRVLHHKGLHAVAGTVIPYASLPVTDPPSLSADHFVWMP